MKQVKQTNNFVVEKHLAKKSAKVWKETIDSSDLRKIFSLKYKTKPSVFGYANACFLKNKKRKIEVIEAFMQKYEIVLQYIIPLRYLQEKEKLKYSITEKYLIQSQDYIERGNINLAIQAINYGLKEDPTSYELRFNKATFEAIDNDYMHAINVIYIISIV